MGLILNQYKQNTNSSNHFIVFKYEINYYMLKGKLVKSELIRPIKKKSHPVALEDWYTDIKMVGPAEHYQTVLPALEEHSSLTHNRFYKSWVHVTGTDWDTGYADEWCWFYSLLTEEEYDSLPTYSTRKQ